MAESSRYPHRHPAHEYARRPRHLDARDHSHHPFLAGARCDLRGTEWRAGGQRRYLHCLCERHRRHGSRHQSRRSHSDPVGRMAATSRQKTGTTQRRKGPPGPRRHRRFGAGGHGNPQGGERCRGLHPQLGRAQRPKPGMGGRSRAFGGQPSSIRSAHAARHRRRRRRRAGSSAQDRRAHREGRGKVRTPGNRRAGSGDRRT